MDVKYVAQGEKGKTCNDCKHFQSENPQAAMGKCFGYDVAAQGSCNMFDSKA